MDLLLEFARNNIREYLEFAVAVCAEASAGRDAVLVDDAEAPKRVMCRVRVTIDRGA